MVKRFRPPKESDVVKQLSIFGPPPFLDGDDLKAYVELFARISSAMKPIDILDEVSIHDITNITWEIHRLRRAKATLVADAVPEVLKSALEPKQNWDDDDYTGYRKAVYLFGEFIDKWAAGDPTARSEVEKLMVSVNLSMGTVTDRAFLATLEKIEHIDRLITINENRRSAIAREMERRRANAFHVLRDKDRIVEDAEYKMIEAKAVTKKNAA